MGAAGSELPASHRHGAHDRRTSGCHTGKQGEDTACVPYTDGALIVCLHCGTSVSALIQEGVTALHKAAQAGYAKIVVKIMEAGADPMATDNVRVLLCHVPCVMELPQEGKTPIDVAKDETIRHLLTNMLNKRELVKE